MFSLFWVPNFMKLATSNFETKSAQVFNFGSRSAILNIIFMINVLKLFWVPNFIALGVYFIFRTKFTWNETIGICFNVEYVLLDRNFDFVGGYCTWLAVTARYRLLLFVPTFSMNGQSTRFVWSKMSSWLHYSDNTEVMMSWFKFSFWLPNLQRLWAHLFQTIIQWSLESILYKKQSPLHVSPQ